jgi:hypothetical protein
LGKVRLNKQILRNVLRFASAARKFGRYVQRGASMGRKAKHHYIPKCYLKGFTNDGENTSEFWAVPKNNDAPFLTSPNDSCAERDYYSVEHTNSLIVEDFYAEQIEPKIIKAINHIVLFSYLPAKEEMKHLIMLLATLYLRVPSHRKSLEMPIRRTKEIVDCISKKVNISNRDEFEYSKTDLIKSELRLIDTVQECLSNKYYQLHIIEDANVNLVTSDNPFILSHPKGGNGFYFGLNTSNIEICVPITNKVILIARNEKMNEGAFVASKELIGLTNTKLILSASRFFYSKTEEVLLVDDDFSVYNHNINTNKTHQRIP